MLGVGVIFGLLSPVSKVLLDSGLISPAGLMMTRTAGAAAAFWTASLFVRREPVALRDRLSLFFAALLGIVLNQGSFILGVSMTSPIDASVVTLILSILCGLAAFGPVGVFAGPVLVAVAIQAGNESTLCRKH